ncbi:PAS domain-containing protein [Chondrinema litorale]|uniref:PAS domain-containing protein n=1 Tax=Chondrinema litorale TaxID=2994555 RepID=UPI002542A736|nr:PAS domain S-box protein [Chondrinema litorale]UZR95890.1 PAS domain S-box protein [Chondrinema litorale]
MSETSNTQAKSYRNLLIFVLAFHALLATGWIVYDNYNNYVENPDQIGLSSLVASATGIVLVIIIWVLLSGAEKDVKQVSQNSTEPEEENQDELSTPQDDQQELTKTTESSLLVYDSPTDFINNVKFKINASEVAIWQYNAENSSLTLKLGESSVQEIEYPDSNILLEKFNESTLIDINDSEYSSLKDISAFSENSFLIAPLKSEGEYTGMLTVSKELQSWSEWEKDYLLRATPFAQLFLKYYLVSEKLEVVEKGSQSTQYLQDYPDFAVATIEVNQPFHKDELTTEEAFKILEDSAVIKKNNGYAEFFDDKALFEILGLDVFRSFLSNDFELKNEKLALGTYSGEENFLFSLKGITSYARLEQIHFIAVRYTEIQNEKNIYSELIEKSSDIFLTLDNEFHIQFLNKSAEDLFGIKSGDSSNLNMLSFLPEENYDTFKNALIDCSENDKRNYLKEIPFRNKQYQTELFDCVIYKLPATYKNSIALELRIIEERLAMEDEFEKKENFLSDILNITDEVITIVDKEGKILYESENMNKQFGYNQAERQGGYGFDYIAPEFTQKVHEDFTKVKDFPSFQGNRVVRFLSKQGVWENIILKQVNLVENPFVQGIVLKFAKTDATQEIVREKNERNEVLEELLNHSPRVYIMLDTEFNIVFINDTIKDMYGLDANTLIGNSFYEYVHPNEMQAIKSNIQFVQANPRELLNATFYFKNDKAIWRKSDSTINALQKKNEISGYLIQLEDVTDVANKETDFEFRAKFYNSMLSSLNNIVIFTDFSANIKYANPVTKQLLGYQLRGNLKDRLHSTSHTNLINALEDVENDISLTKEVSIMIIDKEGNWRKAEVCVKNAKSYSNFKGAILEIIFSVNDGKAEETKNGVHQDISISEKAALTWLNQHTTEGVALFKRDGSIFYKNKQLENLLNTSIVNSQSIKNAVKLEERDNLLSLFNKIAESEEQYVEGNFFLQDLSTQKSLRFKFTNLLDEMYVNAIELTVVENEEEQELESEEDTYSSSENTFIETQKEFEAENVFVAPIETIQEVETESAEDLVSDNTALEIEQKTEEEIPKQEFEETVSETTNIEEEEILEQNPIFEYKDEVITPTKPTPIDGDPEFIDVNDILENSIKKFESEFVGDTVIRKEFKTDNWIVSPRTFIEDIFNNIFDFLASSSSNSGQIMVTAQKADNFSFFTISENFSENSLRKVADNFKTGELPDSAIKNLYDLNVILESHNGKIKIQSETDKGISINVQLPGKIGVSF